jgi:hypothetical protein
MAKVKQAPKQKAKGVKGKGKTTKGKQTKVKKLTFWQKIVKFLKSLFK